MSDLHLGEDPDFKGLRGRADTLEDKDDICILKALYARRADEVFRNPGHASAVSLGELFTDDATLDLGPFGRYTGKANLLNAFQNILPMATAWSTHYIVSPILSVSGDNATGDWYFRIESVAKSPPHAPVTPIFGGYKDKYRKTPRGWKIKESISVFFIPPT